MFMTQKMQDVKTFFNWKISAIFVKLLFTLNRKCEIGLH